MRPFLAVAGEHQEAGVVLPREELQRRGILEGVDRVGFGEAEAVRPFERVEVRQQGAEQRGRGRIAQEERAFGVFDLLGFAFRELPLRAGAFGLAGMVG